MRIVNTLIPFIFTFNFAASTPLKSRQSFRQKHEILSSPSQWRRIATPSPDHILDLRIGLKQSCGSELSDRLDKISDPDHLEYGNYLSSEELRKLVEPADDTIKVVKDWLTEYGLKDSDDVSFSSNRDWLHVKASIEVVQRMLDTEYHVYEHENGIDKAVRALSYSLPEYLHNHIDVIHPTTYFFRPSQNNPLTTVDTISTLQRRSLDMAAGQSKTTAIPVDVLRRFYKTINYTPKATDKNKYSVPGFGGEVAQLSDLQLYMKDERPDAAAAEFKIVSVNDGPYQGVGGESNLDIQTAFGVAYPTPIEYLSVGGLPPFIADLHTRKNTNEPYLELVNYYLSLPDDKLPQTVSMSYGDDEQTVPTDYAKRVCNSFAQLGSRGVSLVVSSGDTGVGPNESTLCKTNDGKNTTMFLPQFPASCPYVTAVGGTQDFNPEVATYSFFSGGGFSNYFSRPSYQDEAVSKYLDKIGDLHKGLYNSSGRGYPDVAAQGVLFKIYFDGKPGTGTGTSASAPLFASIVSLLNDHLLSENKKPLGFLNPFLYKKGYEGLNNIVQGASQGCNTTGFPAIPGWSAVSGLGTPDFEKLVKLIDRL